MQESDLQELDLQQLGSLMLAPWMRCRLFCVKSNIQSCAGERIMRSSCKARAIARLLMHAHGHRGLHALERHTVHKVCVSFVSLW